MPLASRAALGAAATSVALALAVAAPVVALPLFLVAPIPGALLTATVQPAAGLLWAAALGLTAGMLFGTQAAIAVLGMCSSPALVCGTAVRRRWRIEGVIGATVLAWSIGVAATAWYAAGTVGAALHGARGVLESSIDLALSTARDAGASASILDGLAADRSTIVDGVLSMLPALVVLVGGAMALTSALVVRVRWHTAPLANLRRWQMPEPAIWVLIIAGFAMFIPHPETSVIARNVFAVMLGCYFCQGLAVVSFFLARFRVPRGFRVAGYALIALHHLFTGLVLALGVLDFWANFRRLRSGPVNFQSRSGGR